MCEESAIPCHEYNSMPASHLWLSEPEHILGRNPTQKLSVLKAKRMVGSNPQSRGCDWRFLLMFFM